MSTIARELADILGNIQRPGSFYASGTVDVHPPRLEVDGIGTIALPLLPAQAEELIAIAERAPFGRATETIVDTDVRRTWQIGAQRVDLSGQAWDLDLAAMVSQSAAGLGVSDPVEAELYKLLVYDTGSFFLSHRDSEKKAGMFATMVVVLPCEFSGGELRVRHKGQEVQLDLHRDEPSEAAFAAFYADCVHEVLPIASGYRLALIYNLLRVGKGDPPNHPITRSSGNAQQHCYAVGPWNRNRTPSQRRCRASSSIRWSTPTRRRSSTLERSRASTARWQA